MGRPARLGVPHQHRRQPRHARPQAHRPRLRRARCLRHGLRQRSPGTDSRQHVSRVEGRREALSTPWQTQARNLSAARAFAFAASSSLLFGGAFVSSEQRRRVEMPAISSIAARNAPSFAFDGLLKPLIFLTNCSEAARTSSSVTGGSKLKSVLIFLHIRMTSGLAVELDRRFLYVGTVPILRNFVDDFSSTKVKGEPRSRDIRALRQMSESFPLMQKSFSMAGLAAGYGP